MSEETHATIRAEVGQFKQMIEQSSLDGETDHSDLYINVLDDEVRILQQAPGEVVLTYCSFDERFFDDIDLQRDITEETSTDKSGSDFTYRVGAEAILNVEDLTTYLDFASDGGTVELSLTGDDSQRLSAYARASGALDAWVKLPGSQSAIEDVPHWLPFRFSANEVYTNTAGDEAPTVVTTNASKLDIIIDAVEEDQDADFYPLVVKDGEFYVDIGDETRSGVSGTIGAKSVEGPDVENYYYDGFEEIVNVLNGQIELQTAPGNNPVAFVQDEDDGKVIRHVNGTVNA